MKMRFLLDENTSRALLQAILLMDTHIDIVRVGEPDAPAVGTLDPVILLYCEVEQRALLTQNRQSMPSHIADHFAAGHHHWGVFRLRPGFTLAEYAEAIHLLWSASTAEEWTNRDEYIPW